MSPNLTISDYWIYFMKIFADQVTVGESTMGRKYVKNRTVEGFMCDLVHFFSFMVAVDLLFDK